MKIEKYLKTIPTKDLITAYNDFNDMENTGILKGNGREIHNDIIALNNVDSFSNYTLIHLKIAQELIKRYELMNNDYCI